MLTAPRSFAVKPTSRDRAAHALRQWIATVARTTTHPRTRWHILSLFDALEAYRSFSHKPTIAPLLWEACGVLARVLDAHLRTVGAVAGRV